MENNEKEYGREKKQPPIAAIEEADLKQLAVLEEYYSRQFAKAFKKIGFFEKASECTFADREERRETLQMWTARKKEAANKLDAIAKRRKELEPGSERQDVHDETWGTKGFSPRQETLAAAIRRGGNSSSGAQR